MNGVSKLCCETISYGNLLVWSLFTTPELVSMEIYTDSFIHLLQIVWWLSWFENQNGLLRHYGDPLTTKRFRKSDLLYSIMI